MKVVKRDGREEVYNGIKVIKAAESALLESGHTEEEAYRIACAVNEVVANNLPTDQCTISVKNIHILVEDALMDMGLKCAAREYIQYRQEIITERQVENCVQILVASWIELVMNLQKKTQISLPIMYTLIVTSCRYS